MTQWNSVVFIKSNKDWSESNSANIAKWNGVQNIWSTSGEWDWCVKLDPKHSTPEETANFVKKLRGSSWVEATQTSWWKEMPV